MTTWPSTIWQKSIVDTCEKFDVPPADVIYTLLFQLSLAHSVAEADRLTAMKVALPYAQRNAVTEVMGVVGATKSMQEDSTPLEPPVSVLQFLALQAQMNLTMSRANERTMKTQLDAVDPSDQPGLKRAQSTYEWYNYLRRQGEALAFILWEYAGSSTKTGVAISGGVGPPASGPSGSSAD